MLASPASAYEWNYDFSDISRQKIISQFFQCFSFFSNCQKDFSNFQKDRGARTISTLWGLGSLCTLPPLVDCTVSTVQDRLCGSLLPTHFQQIAVLRCDSPKDFLQKAVSETTMFHILAIPVCFFCLIQCKHS